MNSPQTVEEFGPRMVACSGKMLNTKLSGRLLSPDLEQITILVYRYHDFDFRSGHYSTQGRFGIISSLRRAAERGVPITFVTRDPFTESPLLKGSNAFDWYQGLHALDSYENTRVLIHTSLHAKVYLAKSIDDRVFYAVGSSNLTFQGMGFRWAECNVVGYTPPEYDEVEKEVRRIINSRETSTLDEWVWRTRRNPAGVSFFTRQA